MGVPRPKLPRTKLRKLATWGGTRRQQPIWCGTIRALRLRSGQAVLR